MSVANKGMFSVCLRSFPRSESILERVEDGGEAESSSFAALGC